ncbi:PspC domain-containing protein [Salinimicrobium sediminilitoris]|uniref:PspC domain-containing protein n=1 Tax=Salinimicrobium sediminilitoris TaxID=2876715 RepID=UPI001E44CAB0|nr:PspC domain-containing protein [Salinimicrobium sediminilitoris]MCC8361296.1 PspC domain-containing protein [Salinimicrobium sediminilitoris]
MNKTVNINLAGIFYHIDEDAYARLQHYLEAIRRSLTNTSGQEEIIHDIEARIAELFAEKIKNERQVIGIKEVDEVISVMGQPEDYVLDEEIFEDEPVYRKKRGKKLFRDTENSYIGGVSSGLAHYTGIDALWIRILWVLLTIFSTGAFILIYIALWIFVPEAKTTADKLAMRGEPVTISNIERKIREGFDGVSGKMKDINYEKYGYKARSGANSAATAVGDVVKFFLNLFVKLIGIFLLLIAGATLIGLFIGLFSIGTFGIIEAPWTDFVEIAGPGADSIWIISLLAFFAVGIPFFFLFILGLKILVKNLRSIGRSAKLVLLGLWIISVLGLIFFGIQQATERAFDGEVRITENLPVTANDTLYVNMVGDPQFNSTPYQSEDFNISYDDNNRKVIWSQNVQLIVKSTMDSLARLEIIKEAEGKNYEEARQRAEEISYNTSYSSGRLDLSGLLTTDPSNKYREQKVQVTLFLPVGTVLYAADNTYSFHRNTDYYGDILHNGYEERHLKITREGTECLDCPAEEEDPWGDSESDWDTEESEGESINEDFPDEELPTTETDTITGQ